MDQVARASELSACPLFAGVPRAHVELLAEHAQVRRHRRGHPLFAEGDGGDSLFVVVEGSLKAVSLQPDGAELLLAVVERHEVVGELAVADGGVRSASVVALTDVTLLRVPRDAVLAVATQSPELTRALLGSLAAVVRRLTGSAADLAFLDIPHRVAKLVLARGGSDGTAGPRMTQTEMAAAIGASRQSLNIALQDFQRRGWITVRAGGVELRDAAALRRYVGG